MGEFRAVDQQHTIGLFDHDLPRCLADTQHQPGQVFQDRPQPHERNLMRVEKTLEPPFGKVIAANPDNINQSIRLRP
ncbi:hypothetical protein AX23_09485 [Brucella melitensis 548]|nr:hypothetical protein AX23_09485 [Brucella melitensis 548]